MKKHKNLAIEICNLHEAGFKLADYQRDLTFIQKSFLNYAYPVYNKFLKEESENQGSNSTNESWRERYLKQVEEKRKKMEQTR